MCKKFYMLVNANYVWMLDAYARYVRDVPAWLKGQIYYYFYIRNPFMTTGSLDRIGDFR